MCQKKTKRFKSKVDEIIERLDAEGKVYILSDEEVLAIDNHLRKDMEAFKRDLYRKFNQSEKDLRSIVLNA